MGTFQVGYEIHFLLCCSVKLRMCAGLVVEGHCDAGGKLRTNIDPS